MLILRWKLADERGISMVEVLVVMVLIGIVGSVTTTSLVRGMQASASTQSRFDALAELQKSVDRVTRELRAAAPVQVAAADRAVVVVYRNNFTEQVRYTYQLCGADDRLHVRKEGPFQTPDLPAKVAPEFVAPAAPISCATTVPPLIDRVTNTGVGAQAVFQYFPGTVTVTEATADALALPAPVNPSQVRQIRVRIVRSLPPGPGSAAQNPIAVSTFVRLRNVR